MKDSTLKGIKNSVELFSHQLDAIRDMQEKGFPAGSFGNIAAMFGDLTKHGGKTNMLAYHISKLDADTQAKIRANTFVICPSFGLSLEGLTAADLRETCVDWWPQGAGKTSALCRGDMHVAISGGGQVPPRPIDLHAALAGRTIHIEYGVDGGWPSKNVVGCAERPNTTDMYRMYRDQRNKPTRGKK